MEENKFKADRVIDIENNGEKQNELRKIVDKGGIEHVVALEFETNGRVFFITSSKKIFERSENNQYRECTVSDEETRFLSKYLKSPKSLDVEIEY